MLKPLPPLPLPPLLLLCDFYVNRERKFPKVCCACGTLPVPTHVSLTACFIAVKEKKKRERKGKREEEGQR